GAGRPVGGEEGGLRAPVAVLPEAPVEDAGDGGVGEGGGEEVAHVVGLEVAVGEGHVEFGDLDRQAEGGEAVPDLPEFLGRRGGGGEVPLHADAAERGAGVQD